MFKTIQSLQIFGVIKTMTFVHTHTRQIFSMSWKSFLGSWHILNMTKVVVISFVLKTCIPPFFVFFWCCIGILARWALTSLTTIFSKSREIWSRSVWRTRATTVHLHTVWRWTPDMSWHGVCTHGNGCVLALLGAQLWMVHGWSQWDTHSESTSYVPERASTQNS